jgi:hypothetical protein
VSRVRCKGCATARVTQVRQLRIYSTNKQFQFRLVLCSVCFGGLFDLLVESADGWSEGLWSALDQNARSHQN